MFTKYCVNKHESSQSEGLASNEKEAFLVWLWILVTQVTRSWFFNGNELLCFNTNMKPHMQKKPIYYYLRFPTWELVHKAHGQVHTRCKTNDAASLPLPWAIYCCSAKWTSCLPTDITHNSTCCQVLVQGPLRCSKSAIHICAGSPLVYF